MWENSVTTAITQSFVFPMFHVYFYFMPQFSNESLSTFMEAFVWIIKVIPVAKAVSFHSSQFYSIFKGNLFVSSFATFYSAIEKKSISLRWTAWWLITGIKKLNIVFFFVLGLKRWTFRFRRSVRHRLENFVMSSVSAASVVTCYARLCPRNFGQTHSVSTLYVSSRILFTVVS